jgi:hypothetical protein
MEDWEFIIEAGDYIVSGRTEASLGVIKFDEDASNSNRQVKGLSALLFYR